MIAAHSGLALGLWLCRDALGDATLAANLVLLLFLAITAYALDGIYIGARSTGPMRKAMLQAVVA